MPGYLQYTKKICPEITKLNKQMHEYAKTIKINLEIENWHSKYLAPKSKYQKQHIQP